MKTPFLRFGAVNFRIQFCIKNGIGNHGQIKGLEEKRTWIAFNSNIQDSVLRCFKLIACHLRQHLAKIDHKCIRHRSHGPVNPITDVYLQPRVAKGRQQCQNTWVGMDRGREFELIAVQLILLYDILASWFIADDTEGWEGIVDEPLLKKVGWLAEPFCNMRH